MPPLVEDLLEIETSVNRIGAFVREWRRARRGNRAEARAVVEELRRCAGVVEEAFLKEPKR